MIKTLYTIFATSYILAVYLHFDAYTYDYTRHAIGALSLSSLAIALPVTIFLGPPVHGFIQQFRKHSNPEGS